MTNMPTKMNIQEKINELYKLNEEDIHDYYFSNMDTILMCDRHSIHDFLLKVLGAESIWGLGN